MVITQTERHIVYEVLARHFPGQDGTTRDELESAGFLGLAQAATRYDPALSDATFRTFAWRRIRGAMQDVLRTEDHLSRTERKIVQAGGYDPGPTVVMGADDEMCAMEDPRDHYAELDLKDALDFAIGELPARQQFVIFAVYYGDWVMSEVADLFGVTESRICQIHRQAINALRATLDGADVPSTVPVAA